MASLLIAAHRATTAKTLPEHTNFTSAMIRTTTQLLFAVMITVTTAVAAESVETLQLALKKSEGSARIPILAELVSQIRSSDPQLAIDYANQGLALLEQHPDPEREVDILNEQSWAYRVQGNHPDALRAATNSLNIAQDAGYLHGAARAHNNIGVVYFYVGDNDLALDNWLEALRLREQLGDDNGIAGSLNNIGLLYARQGDHDRAISHLERALEISRRNGNKNYELNHLDNLGEAYAEQGNFEAAEQYYRQALSIARNSENPEGELSVLVNLGALYVDRGNWSSAQRYLNEGKTLSASIGGRSKMAEADYYLAMLYREQGDTQKAAQTAHAALELAEALGEKHLMRDLQFLLAEMHEENGEFAKALTHFQAYTALQTQLFQGERQDKLALLQTRYEAAANQREIALLTKDRALKDLELSTARTSQRIAQAGVIAATVLALALFLAFRSRSRSRSRLATIVNNYQQLLYSLPLGVLAVDEQGVEQFSNPALHEITHQESPEFMRLKQHALALLAAGRGVEEWQLPIEGQPPKNLVLIVEERLDDNGMKSGFWLIAMDLTEQKATNAQLVQASKLATLGEMSTGMAHELNQPLNVISLAVSNLKMSIKRGRSTDDVLLAKLDKITAAVGRAAHIIDHMRAYGRVANEGLSTIDIHEVAISACGLLSEQLKLSNIRLINNISEPGALMTRGNAIQLEQVLLNLINNARDAILSTADSGDIQLDAALVDGDIKLTVSDTGGGIPENVLPHIFEPFFTTKPVGKGTGLGGSISYGIIRDMQGDMWAENVGSGAQITISMPHAARA